MFVQKHGQERHSDIKPIHGLTKIQRQRIVVHSLIEFYGPWQGMQNHRIRLYSLQHCRINGIAS